MVDGSRRPHPLFSGPGETRAALRAKDWSSTPLGPVETWSDELRAAIRTVLPSEIPMLLWWGPRLVQIFNDAYTPVLGDKYPDAIGQPGAECWAEVWDQLGPMADAVLAGGGATYAENQPLLLRRHGYLEETYWTFSYSPVTGADGSVLGVFVATTDVTERVLGDRRMETLRSFGELSTAAAETGTAACRDAVRVLAASPADVPFALAYLREGEGTGGPLTLVASTGVAADADPRPVLGEIDEVADRGEPVAVTGLAERLPGTGSVLGPAPVDRALVLPLQAFGRTAPIGVLVLGLNPYRELDGPYRMFAELVANYVSTALTDALAYAEERARAAALAELNAAKTRFFQNVSHEFRTPLTLLLGPLRTMLAEGRLPEPHREAVAVAHRAALRLRRLVDTLLDITRAEADRLRADPEPTDVARLTEECASMFRSAAASAGIALVVRAAPAGTVLLDREMWAKIVLNLVSNAVRHTPAGSVTVTLAATGGKLVLTVSDTGVGIPADELDRIFDRFHQVADRRGRGDEGTGIGLSLVRDLVAALGGTVTVASTLGAGSTFVATVPEVPADTPAAGAGAALPAELGEAFAGEAGQWRPATPGEPVDGGVLLVEDNADMRAYLTRLLREQDWPVYAVGDAERALAHAIEHRPDLVLSDVMLPGRDGLALVREIRAHEALRRVPVVLLTARAGHDSAAEGLREGADDYVVKPFHPEELVSRVRAHLELSRLREAVIAENERELTTLRGALDSRSTVSQAVGLLMATHRCDADTAFQQLVAVSQATNRKVRDIAATVVSDFTDRLARDD